MMNIYNWYLCIIGAINSTESSVITAWYNYKSLHARGVAFFHLLKKFHTIIEAEVLLPIL